MGLWIGAVDEGFGWGCGLRSLVTALCSAVSSASLTTIAKRKASWCVVVLVVLQKSFPKCEPASGHTPTRAHMPTNRRLMQVVGIGEGYLGKWY